MALKLDNKALAKIFPDSKTLEEKAWNFLIAMYRNNWSYNATGKEVGLHHNTVRDLLEELKYTDLYIKFVSSIAEQVNDFYNRDLSKTIYSRFEEEIADLRTLEKSARERGDIKLVLDIKRMVISIFNTELRANLAIQLRSSSALIDEDDDFKKKNADLYMEAKKKAGRHSNNSVSIVSEE